MEEDFEREDLDYGEELEESLKREKELETQLAMAEKEVNKYKRVAKFVASFHIDSFKTLADVVAASEKPYFCRKCGVNLMFGVEHSCQ